MIKRTGLRIGNTILFNGERDEVTSIGKFINGKNHGIYSEDLLEGIPITEDTLVELGFTSTEKYRYSNGVIDIFFDDNEMDYLGMSCKYLHELQNAYPVWTNGIELLVR